MHRASLGGIIPVARITRGEGREEIEGELYASITFRCVEPGKRMKLMEREEREA